MACRDWLIDALNANIPFDRFTLEQLAGDFLPTPRSTSGSPPASIEIIEATAKGGSFPRSSPSSTSSTGSNHGTVWLGLTFGCARCHDHKYDPFATKRFYQLFAFFQPGARARGRAVKVGNSPPFLKTPTREQQERLAAPWKPKAGRGGTPPT